MKNITTNFYNKKLIQITNDWEVGFTEWQNKITDHPLQNSFLNKHDLSINAIINLKWLLWGIFYFKSISEQIDIPELEYNEKPIQTIIYPKKLEHIFLINNTKIENNNQINDIIDKYEENTNILITLKLNIDEYLNLTGYIWPCMIKKM